MAVATLTAPVVEAAKDSFAALRPRLLGRLLTPGDVQYDSARRVVNFTNTSRPLAIVRAADADDVAEAVAFARLHDLPLAVKSGGHSIASLSVVPGSFLIDLAHLNRIEIDAEARIARVQPGATSGELAKLAEPFGLALTTGDTQSVGFGGLTTGGGIGFMVRKYGLTIDNLISAEVVTAAGEIVTASTEEHPDLFWAIRGGGGNVGIVTEFTFRLAPIAQILGGELMLPATREVLRGYLDYVASAPDDLTTIANLEYAPPFPHVPNHVAGTLVFSVLVCWSGDMAAGEAALAPLRALAAPLVDTIAPMPYAGIYKYTEHFTQQHGSAIRMMFADELNDATLDASLEAMKAATSPFSLIQIRGLGGEMARVADDATAFAHRERRYFYSVIGIWLDPAVDGEPTQVWTADLWQKVRGDGAGVYVNFLEREGEARVMDAYPPATFARLAAIKQRYDPTNLFHFNQNVPPMPLQADARLAGLAGAGPLPY